MTDFIDCKKLLTSRPIIEQYNLNPRKRAIIEIVKKMVLQNKYDLYTLSIMGDWGTGKTSILKVLNDCFTKHINQNNDKDSRDRIIIPVWFESWRFQHELEIYPALLRTISADVLKYCIEPKSKKILKNLAVVSWGLLNLFQGFKANIPIVGLEYSAKDAYEGSRKAMADLSKQLDKSIFADINEIGISLYYEAWQLLKRIVLEIKLHGHPISILIFIDDLDRCLPATAFRMLEKIKIWLEIDNYTTILALNKTEIELTVATHLEKELKTGNNRLSTTDIENLSKEYILKILPLSLYVDKSPFFSNNSEKVDADNANLILINKALQKILKYKNNNYNDFEHKLVTFNCQIKNNKQKSFPKTISDDLEEKLKLLYPSKIFSHRQLNIVANELYLEKCLLPLIEEEKRKDIEQLEELKEG